MAPVRMRVGDVAAIDGDRENAYNQFLDDYLHAGDAERTAMVHEQPPASGDPILDARIAALVELLSHTYSLEVPDWVYQPSYYLAEPVWALPGVCGRDENARRYFEGTTCDEFKKRNLMLGDNLLGRC